MKKIIMISLLCILFSASTSIFLQAPTTQKIEPTEEEEKEEVEEEEEEKEEAEEEEEEEKEEPEEEEVEKEKEPEKKKKTVVEKKEEEPEEKEAVEEKEEEEKEEEEEEEKEEVEEKEEEPAEEGIAEQMPFIRILKDTESFILLKAILRVFFRDTPFEKAFEALSGLGTEVMKDIQKGIIKIPPIGILKLKKREAKVKAMLYDQAGKNPITVPIGPIKLKNVEIGFAAEMPVPSISAELSFLEKSGIKAPTTRVTGRVLAGGIGIMFKLENLNLPLNMGTMRRVTLKIGSGQ
jgi:flagellar biosynthesis GTPase FlhF